jgi:hypothetical protein
MGQDLTKIICASCGAELEPEDRFCDQCGSEVQGSEFKVQGFGEERVEGGVRSAECGVTSEECGVRSEGRSAADPAADTSYLGGETEVEPLVESAGFDKKVNAEENEDRGVQILVSTRSDKPDELQDHSGLQAGVRSRAPEENERGAERRHAANPFQNRMGCDELSDCTQFRLEYNESRIFVEGRPSSFNFRLTALNDEAKKARKITLDVSFGNGMPSLEKPLGYTFGAFRTQHLLNVPHTPELAGVGIHAEVVLRFELKGRPHRYGTNIQWNCISPQNQQKALESLVINLKADANYAADQNIRLLENLGKSHHESLGSELEKLNLQPRWMPLPLSELEGMSLSLTLPPIVQGNLPVRTLHLPGGIRVHLIHGSRVTLGRQKEINTLAIRLFDEDGCVMSHETRRISRTHCAFVLSHNGLRLVDGDGMGARSSAGSFLDGKPLNAEGVVLGPRKNYALGLGSPILTDLSTFRIFTGIANDWIRRVQWAALRRQDGLSSKELFLLLDGECSLREVQADLPDLDVRRTETGFAVFCDGRPIEFDGAGNDPCSGLRFTPYQPLGIQL